MESERIKSIICNNPIEAEGFRSALQETGIESKLYDETNSKVARGILDNTVEVLVKEEEYEQAIKVYRSFLTVQQSFTPWCPKCGSENVTIQKKRSATVRQLPRILATLLTFIPIGVCTTEKYICKDCGHKWERC